MLSLMGGLILLSCSRNNKKEELQDIPLQDDCTRFSFKIDKSEKTFTLLHNLFQPKQTLDSNDSGKPISWAEADSCIAGYVDSMIRHAFDTTGDQRYEANTLTRKITKEELLAGPNLLEWMLATSERLDPDSAGIRVGFAITPGILNDAFLMRRFPEDEAMRMKKRNRVSFFIVPFLINNTYSRQRIELTPDQKRATCVYELGGLQP